MGPIGWPETVFIVILALLLFGPKKLPELGRTLGRAITEFRRASSELRSTFDREMRNLEREVESTKEIAGSHFNDSYNYDYSSYDSGTPYGSESSSYDQTHTAEAQSHSLASHTENGTTGASADQGAESTASNPGLSVTPATGTIASGSLESENAGPHTPEMAPGTLEEPARETIKS